MKSRKSEHGIQAEETQAVWFMQGFENKYPKISYICLVSVKSQPLKVHDEFCFFIVDKLLIFGCELFYIPPNSTIK